ncbi:hypothetical protein FQN50_003198 [Emmonsiellopsis sp. PD_5]|nr:hypothetical protein FQN50_003198 [Emmonsiellopsis sp. PD_5]
MSLGIMVACPLFTIFWYIALQNFDASLLSASFALWDEGFVNFFRQYSPSPNREIVFVYGAWVLFQAVLYTFLPGKICEGQPTPAGNVLKYKTNGLLASIVTVFFFAVLGLRSSGLTLAFVAEHWGSFVAIFNIYGLFLTAAFYLKAHISPSHLEDRNDLSFIAQQFYKFGYVTNSIIITGLLHATYVIDLFYNEDWYIKTIDIAHDHVGFYLAWGSATWLPMMYTLQPQFLAVHPVSLSPIAAASILITGFGGYALFRSANHQKYLVRDTKGQCTIWGKPPKVIYGRYKTANGSTHESIILCSGWWGVVRHANYLGDLFISFSMCATCGITHLLPWTYALFMTTILVHRCYRDEKRCAKKYGKTWDDYCAKVRWRIVPGIF